MNTATTAPDTLPAGIELPDRCVLAFGPHRECPCTDCADAFAALDAGLIDLEVRDGYD